MEFALPTLVGQKPFRPEDHDCNEDRAIYEESELAELAQQFWKSDKGGGSNYDTRD